MQYADLLDYYDALPVERKRSIFHLVRDEARALNKVVTMADPLTNREFFAEADRLARGSGLRLNELSIALQPSQYESYFIDSTKCRLDRYRSRDGSIDIRVQAFHTTEFRHSLWIKPWSITVLSGRVDIVRDGGFVRVPANMGVNVEGTEEVTIRATAGARFVYVDHPLTAWIRHNMAREEGS